MQHNTVKILLLFSMLFSFILLSSDPKPSEPLKEFDFGIEKSGEEWNVMNDGVMGGLSEGVASLNENSLLLKGNISLANNGGFSSIRSPWGKKDLGAYDEVSIRYRSSGQVVAMSFEIYRRWWRPYYLLDLQPTDDEWKTVTLPLSSAKEISVVAPTGKSLTPEKLSKILRIGFMTHEKKASPFEFEVDYVRFE